MTSLARFLGAFKFTYKYSRTGVDQKAISTLLMMSKITLNIPHYIKQFITTCFHKRIKAYSKSPNKRRKTAINLDKSTMHFPPQIEKPGVLKGQKRSPEAIHAAIVVIGQQGIAGGNCNLGEKRRKRYSLAKMGEREKPRKNLPKP